MGIHHQYSWTADRDEESYLPETATDHGNGTLTINNITEMDGRRKYCCDVSNEHGQQYNCISLAVLSEYSTSIYCCCDNLYIKFPQKLSKLRLQPC